jgi:hypothetical protein
MGEVSLQAVMAASQPPVARSVKEVMSIFMVIPEPFEVCFRRLAGAVR